MPTYHAPPAKKGFYAFVEGFFETFLLGGSMSTLSSEHPKRERIKDEKGNRILIPDMYYAHYKNNEKSGLSLGLPVNWDAYHEKEEELKKPLIEQIQNNHLENIYVKEFIKNKEKFDYYEWEEFLKKKLRRFVKGKFWLEHNKPYNEDSDEEIFLTPVRYKDLKKFQHKGPLWHHLGDRCKGQILEAKGSWVKTEYDVYVKALQKEFSHMKKYWLNDDSAMSDENFWGGRISRDHMEVFIEKIEK